MTKPILAFLNLTHGTDLAQEAWFGSMSVSDKSSQNRQLEKCFPALKMVSVLISLESLEAQSLSLSASLESEAAASLPSS